MSQFVETRVGDFLGRADITSRAPQMPRPAVTKEEATQDSVDSLTADQIFTF